MAGPPVDQPNRDYTPVWDAPTDCVREPDIFAPREDGTGLPEVHIGWSKSDRIRHTQDAVWGHLTPAEHVRDRKLVCMTESGHRVAIHKVAELHDFWKHVKESKLRAEVDAYLRSRIDMSETDRLLAQNKLLKVRDVPQKRLEGRMCIVQRCDETRDKKRKRKQECETPSASQQPPQSGTSSSNPNPDLISRMTHQLQSFNEPGTRFQNLDIWLHRFSLKSISDKDFDRVVAEDYVVFSEVAAQTLPPLHVFQAAKRQVDSFTDNRFHDVREMRDWKQWVRENNVQGDISRSKMSPQRSSLFSLSSRQAD